MKPKSTLRHFLALAGGSLLAISSASAQTTYTWNLRATGSQDWETVGNWAGGTKFVSGSGNELAFSFLAETPTRITGTQTITNVPTALSMNTLTLGGAGPNDTAGLALIVGTSASTWTIGDGTTSTVNLNSTLGGGGADRDIRYTIGTNLTLVGNASGITTFTGNSTSGYGAVFSGNITGSGKGITKSGSSLLVFSGNNSYTGTTLVSGGVLRLSSTNALSGGIGTTGGTSALTINGGVVELGVGDFSRGLGAGSSQFQITGGTSGFSAYGGPRVVTVNGDASEELVWGSTHFAPATLVLNQLYGFHSSSPVYPNGSIELTNKLDLNGTTRIVQVGANIALLSNDIRTSTGTAGLTKTGGGALVLTGNNTYNGNTTLSAGVLSVDAANNLGAGSSNLVLNGGTLQIRGTTLTSLTGLGRTVSLTNNVNVGFDIHNAANSFTVDQVLNNNNGTRTLTKSGVGTLVLNQNNTFTGATGASGGKLVLDYTTNNGSKLSDTAGLTLSGTALVLKGGVGAGANHAEVVSSTTITTYTSNSISRDGGTSTISLGGLSLGTNSSLGISEANLATTTSSNTNGILLLGRVTVGNHFGANDGSNNIVAYSGYTTYTADGLGNIAGGGSASVVNQLTGGGTMGASLSSYALRIVNDANSNVLDLANNNLSLSNAANNSTLLYAGGFDNNYTINGTGAITQASGNQSFVINTYAGTTLTVNARTSSNFAPVSKAGAGTLVFGGNNANIGGAFVQEGVLRVTHKDGLGNTTSGTTVLGGAALELANTIAIGTETLSLNGAGIFDGTSYRGALRNQSGTNSWAGNITIGASGARINADASSTLTLTGGITTTLTQDVTFGGAGSTTVSTTAITGSGSVIKDGVGTLTLSADNTYTGTTTVTAGKLLVNNTTGSGTGIGTVDVGALGTLGGTGTISGAVNVTGQLSPGASIETLGTGTLSMANSSTLVHELNSSVSTAEGSDLLKVTGNLNLAGTVNLMLADIALTDVAFAVNDVFSLINYTGTWNVGLFTYSGNELADEEVFTFGLNTWKISYDDVAGGLNYDTEYVAGSFVNITAMSAIPEPGAALLGSLGVLLLFRRRR